MVSKRDIKNLANIFEFSDRLEFAATLAKGSIVEIGGGEGINTLRFLRVLEQRDCISEVVFVVDPFQQIPGADESYFMPYTLERFKQTVAKYLDEMIIIDLPSQDPQVRDFLSTVGLIGFMFIDGLQDQASVLSDLRMAESLGVSIICVDDYNRLTASSQVPLAVAEFTPYTKYKFIDIGTREAYFIKK